MQKQFEIYVGLNDKETLKSHRTTKEVCDDFLKFFSEYGINFSISPLRGGYAHSNGQFVLEDSLKIVVIADFERKRISRFAKEVKKYFNQESLLIVEKNINAVFKN